MPSFADPIVAVRLSAKGRTGITLFAPPWEDSDGEEWQGFLGDGAKIVLFGTTSELNTWLGDNPDHDLADHPAWTSFSNRGTKVLQPADEAAYDFDAVYELAAADPDPQTVSQLADTVDIAGRVADCCEDGMLRSLLNGTREYALLVEARPTTTARTAAWSGSGSAMWWPRAGSARWPGWSPGCAGRVRRPSRSKPMTSTTEHTA